jgi:hypothetical protein
MRTLKDTRCGDRGFAVETGFLLWDLAVVTADSSGVVFYFVRARICVNQLVDSEPTCGLWTFLRYVSAMTCAIRVELGI